MPVVCGIQPNSLLNRELISFQKQDAGLFGFSGLRFKKVLSMEPGDFGSDLNYLSYTIFSEIGWFLEALCTSRP